MKTLLNPFPGLRPFRTDEDYLFFGREGQSEDLLRQLRLNRFLAVVGISGSGKSSLIRAGLLPYIFGGFMSGASSHWRVAIFRPGNNPLENLAHALSDPAVLGQAGTGESDEAKSKILLEVTLRRSGLGLIEAARLAKLRENEHLLIVVDQFEELFRFGKTGNAIHQQDDAVAFVKLLIEASNQTALPIYVVITMRSDFIGDCARFRDLPEIVTAGLYLIPRMSREQRRKAIEEPVRVGNGNISRRLINRLLNDGGDDPDQLPSLQHALMRTWNYWEAQRNNGNPIDLDDYLAVGGISDALSRHAEEAFEELPDERSRAIAKRLFQSLTEKGPDNREVRRPTKLADIAAMADAEEAEVISVIDRFRLEGRSFLTPPPDVELESNSVIDISHESLIRGWGRLKAWVEEEYESAKMYRRLAETTALYAEGKAGLWHDPDLSNALRWRQNEKPTQAWARCYHPNYEEAMAFLEESQRARDEAAAELQRSRRQKLRNARLFAATVMVLFLVAAATAIDAIHQKRNANREQEEALRNARMAQTESNRAKAQEQAAKVQRTQALANQDMALGFASSTVRRLSGLSDFVVGQHDVQEQFESLLKEAATVHDNVLQREPNNLPASVMRINGLAALSRIHMMAGHSKTAEEECEKQEAEGTKLAQTSADDSQRLLAAYLLATASTERTALQQKERARADMQAAVRIADAVQTEGVLKGIPSDQQALRCLSIVYNVAATFDDDAGNLKDAVRYKGKAAEVLTKYENETGVGSKGHLDDRSRQYLISYLNSLASLQAKANQRREASDTYSRAIRLANSWSAENDKDSDPSDTLFWLYVGRADIEVDGKQYTQAEQDFNSAKALAAKALNLKMADGQYDDAVAEERLGNLEHYRAESEKDSGQRQKELQIALERHQKALEMFRQMEGGKGKDPAVEYYIGSEERNLGWDFSTLEQPAKAKDHYINSNSSWRIAAEVAQTDGLNNKVALSYRTLGEYEQQSSNFPEAVKDYDEALKAEKKVTDPDDNMRHLQLQDTLQLADSQFNNQQIDASLKTYKEGIEEAEKWTQNAGASPDLFKDIVELYLGRGDVELSQKAYVGAEKDFVSARDDLKHLDLTSVDGEYTRSLVSERFGVLWQNQADEAEGSVQNEYLLRAKKFQDEAAKERHQVEAAGKNANIEHSIGITERNLGSTSFNLKDFDDAHQHYAASTNAYEQSEQLNPTEQAKADLVKAYRMLAAVDVDHGNKELTEGNYAEADKYFQSARSTAKRTDAAGMDGRYVRRFVELYIANDFREKSGSDKDKAQREMDSRRALEADENLLKLSQEIAQTTKSDDALQSVADAEGNIGLDYSQLGDEENARKSFGASLKTLQQMSPGDDTTRAMAGAYRVLAQIESNLDNKSAERDAYGKEIELLLPLINKTEDAKTASSDRKTLASAFGNRSWGNALLGDPWAALSDAQQGSILDNTQTYIEVNKGDAYLLLGQVDAARKIYFAITDENAYQGLLHDLDDIGSHPELKVDPKVIASIRNDLTKRTPSDPRAAVDKH